MVNTDADTGRRSAIRPTPILPSSSCVLARTSPGSATDRVYLSHLTVSELESEQVEVGSDPRGLHGLGDDHDVALHIPAQHDLGRADRVGRGDPGEGRMVKLD